MLVAGLLAAAAVGQWVAAPQGDCPPGSTAETRFADNIQGRRCVALTPATEDDLASKQFLCQPALENFQCCFAVYGTNGQDNNQLICAAAPQGTSWWDDSSTLCTSTEVTEVPDDRPNLQVATVWCGDDATTTTSTNLEPAAIAAIAVTPVLLIAAAAGIAL